MATDQKVGGSTPSLRASALRASARPLEGTLGNGGLLMPGGGAADTLA
jgi:hypothetical protein